MLAPVFLLCAQLASELQAPPQQVTVQSKEDSSARADAAPRDAVDIGSQLTTVDRLRGSYKNSGGQRDIKAVEKAVERSAQSVVFLFRGIARRRLREANRIAKQVHLRRRGSLIEVQWDKVRRSAAIGGNWTWWTDQYGDKVQLRYKVRGRRIIETIKSDGGQRRNIYSPGKDGHSVVIHVEITSERLPQPIKYKLHYKRQRIDIG